MLDEAGRVADPVVLVNLDDPRATVPPADGQLRVGVATGPVSQAGLRLLGDLDLALVPSATDGAAVPHEAVAVRDPGAQGRELREATARSPQAVLVLGQVLRASERLPVPAALDVESFAYSMLLGGAAFRRWLDDNGGRPLPPMVDDPVLIDRDSDDVLRVTLNRPQRRNAYGRQLRDALTDALRVALLDPSVDHVVLDGAGPCFCSGGDLAEFGTAPDLVTAHFVRTLAGAGRLAHALRERLEVHVHGPCVGAGVELPAFAGRVIAAAGTTFTLPEVAMGLIPGAGGTVSIPRRVGRWRALFLALSGQPLDAATALAWGLIDEIAGLAVLLVGRDRQVVPPHGRHTCLVTPPSTRMIAPVVKLAAGLARCTTIGAASSGRPRRRMGR
jgi:enoyl-CoA hydratase/carnithine racemase